MDSTEFWCDLTLGSEEDRSNSCAGLLGNNRRIDAPILEARLLLRVSSLLDSIKFSGVLWPRTIPENGTADNLSFIGGSLFRQGIS